MKVKLRVGYGYSIDDIDEIDLDKFKIVLPKHIDITTLEYLDINDLKDALELFDSSLCSFS
jgi:hypothetical protein